MLSYFSKPFFTPPRLKTPDFTKHSSYKKWSDSIKDQVNAAIARVEKEVGIGNSQFYNANTNPAGDDKQQKQVLWQGFPLSLRLQYPQSFFEEADKHTPGFIHNGENLETMRNQDEYLEWYVHKDENGTITQIDFTCESPEYWEHLFDRETDVCLELYRTYISPNVKLEDLCVNDTNPKVRKYSRLNKWNTEEGCMHLNCKPNALLDEIDITADATIIRQKNGKIITDPGELIDCSKYGVATRNSDPHIGSKCNTLCQAGFRITLANPVCLYIAKVDTSGWKTPDGKDASKYMKMVRGKEGSGLRYTLNVPEAEGFKVGDITIGGEPIQYGGQVAVKMTIGLTAEACKNATGAQPPRPCKC